MITDLNDQNFNEIRVVLFVYFKAKGKLVYKLKYRSRYVFAALFNKNFLFCAVLSLNDVNGFCRVGGLRSLQMFSSWAN